jgi:hypothetical protein
MKVTKKSKLTNKKPTTKVIMRTKISDLYLGDAALEFQPRRLHLLSQILQFRCGAGEVFTHLGCGTE